MTEQETQGENKEKNQLSEIQSILDENKESIPDNVYLTISDKLKQEFDHKNNFYEVKYLTSRFILVSDEDASEYKQVFGSRTKIMKFCEHVYESISSEIENRGMATDCDQGFINNITTSTSDPDFISRDDEETYARQFMNNIEIYSTSVILRITKI